MEVCVWKWRCGKSNAGIIQMPFHLLQEPHVASSLSSSRPWQTSPFEAPAMAFPLPTTSATADPPIGTTFILQSSASTHKGNNVFHRTFKDNKVDSILLNKYMKAIDSTILTTTRNQFQPQQNSLQHLSNKRNLFQHTQNQFHYQNNVFPPWMESILAYMESHSASMQETSSH